MTGVGEEVEEDAVQARLNVGGEAEGRLREAESDDAAGGRTEALELGGHRRTEAALGTDGEAQVTDM